MDGPPQEREPEAAGGPGDAAPGESAEAGGSARDVREVVGRRGHDEAEDETTSEDEEH